MTIDEAFQKGHLKLRLEPWPEGEYIELQPVQGGYAPFAKMHSVLESPDVPDGIRWDGPKDVGLWMMPDGDWLAVTTNPSLSGGES